MLNNFYTLCVFVYAHDAQAAYMPHGLTKNTSDAIKLSNHSTN